MIEEQANFLNFSNSTLTLQSKKASLFARIVLLVLVIKFFLNTLMLIVLVIFAFDINFGHLILFIILSLIGYYFLRLFLWNSYGKEIIVFDKERIYYFADFKLFKDSRKSINSKNAKFEIKEISSSTSKMGLLKISNESEVIETVTKLNMQEFAYFVKNNNLPITPFKI